jgi:pyrimidine deaminase RibD-like protein
MTFTTKHERLLKYALRRAHDAPLQKAMMGCVIAQGSVPIGSGVNDMLKTHPKAAHYPYPYLHAELAALTGIDEQEVRGAIAYVARRTKAGKQGMAKPCEYCEAMMRRLGLRGAFYTTTDGTGYLDLR